MTEELSYQEVDNYKTYNDRLALSAEQTLSSRIDFTKIFIWLIMLFNVLFISLVIASLFLKSSLASVLTVIHSLNTIRAIRITFSSIFCSAMMTMIIGIPFAYLTAQKKGKLYRIMNMIVNLPLVLPPVVGGLALLMAFGRRGAFSRVINFFGLNIPFSFLALIIVQVFVMLPLFTQALRNGFAAIKPDIKEAAMVFGAGEKELLFLFYLPLSVRPFLTGLIMACLRAAGEFGATMMFAGNLSGKTQTMATAIYTLSQKNLGQSISLAVVLILLFLLPLLLLELKLKE